jgi:hypothetical protein
MRSFDRFHDYLANLSEMMERLGIDPDDAIDEHAAQELETVIRACQRCGLAEACRAWLNRAPAAVSRPPAFCPSADRLEDLAIGQPLVPYRHTIH